MNMSGRKLTKRDKSERVDLVFHFIDPKVEVELEEGWFDDDSEKEVLELIDNLKKSIWIDKTYVGFDDSKYSDVFLTEEGWTALCKMLVISRFGKTLPATGQEQLAESYPIMVICYIYGELIKRGWDYEHISITPAEDHDIEAEVYIDETSSDSWREYRGTWQELELEAEEKAAKKRKKTS